MRRLNYDGIFVLMVVYNLLDHPEQTGPADALSGPRGDRAGACDHPFQDVPARVPGFPEAMPGQGREGEVVVQGAPRAQGRESGMFVVRIVMQSFLDSGGNLIYVSVLIV